MLRGKSCGHQFSAVLENGVLATSGTGEELRTLSYLSLKNEKPARGHLSPSQ